MSRPATGVTDSSHYAYPDAAPRWDDDEVWRAVRQELQHVAPPGTRVFELGCGNGATAARMAALGYRVTAVDPSVSGIAVAKAAHPAIDLHVGAAEEPLADRFGRFPVVISIEVVEHCYSPRRFATAAWELLEPGGHLILSTPYHGYLKNLVLAVTGKMDAHFTTLWEGGHIKFFSRATISKLLSEAGLYPERVKRVGRVAPLARSMVVTARRL